MRNCTPSLKNKLTFFLRKMTHISFPQNFIEKLWLRKTRGWKRCNQSLLDRGNYNTGCEKFWRDQKLIPSTPEDKQETFKKCRQKTHQMPPRHKACLGSMSLNPIGLPPLEQVSIAVKKEVLNRSAHFISFGGRSLALLAAHPWCRQEGTILIVLPHANKTRDAADVRWSRFEIVTTEK